MAPDHLADCRGCGERLTDADITPLLTKTPEHPKRFWLYHVDHLAFPYLGVWLWPFNYARGNTKVDLVIDRDGKVWHMHVPHQGWVGAIPEEPEVRYGAR